MQKATFSEPKTLNNLPRDIDVAYYLIHSMSSSIGNFMKMEEESARNFVRYIENSSAQQVIYLSGLINSEAELSPHLKSRYKVEQILSESTVPHTVLRAGIIVGSGSASFEIIRDLGGKTARNDCPAVAPHQNATYRCSRCAGLPDRSGRFGRGLQPLIRHWRAGGAEL
ncbi:MAG: hypothetical protein U5L09_10630 [Bacteroidales bacterium]|nr:hypothetical protein [Bacteroidales bacterium]